MPKNPTASKVNPKSRKLNSKSILFILGLVLSFGLGVAGSMWYFYQYIYVVSMQDWITNPRQVAYEVKAEHGAIANDQTKLNCMYTYHANTDQAIYDEYEAFTLTINANKLHQSDTPGQPWENTQDFSITANTEGVIQAYKVTNTNDFGGTPFTFYDYLVIDKTTGAGVSVQQGDGVFADKLDAHYVTAHFVCK